jgi:hypothetical protein
LIEWVGSSPYVTAGFGSEGALAAQIAQVYPVLAALAGDGALSASAASVITPVGVEGAGASVGYAGGLSTPGAAKSISWNQTCSGSPKEELIVTVACGGADAGSSFTTRTVTYGPSNTPLTLLGTGQASNRGFIDIWKLDGPPAVTNGAINVNYKPPSHSINGLIGGSCAYSGVGSVAAPVTASSNTINPSQTVTSAANRMVVQAVAAFPSTGSGITAYSQTQRNIMNGNFSQSNEPAYVMGDAPGAASVVFNTTCAQMVAWASIACELLP